VITGHGRSSALLETDLSGESNTGASRTYTATLLTFYVILLMFIPSALVLAPLGGSGGPATLFAVALAGWYLTLWLHTASALDRGRQPVRAAAIIFTCAIVAAYVSANRRTLPALEQNGADRGLILMAGWFGVLLLAADGIDRWAQLRTVLRRIVNCATAIAVIGITQFAIGLNIATYVVIPGLITKVPFVDLTVRDGLNRPSATTAQPLEFAAVLALCLPLALHQARFAAPGSRARRWLQVALIAGAMPLAVSRSAVLGLVTVALTLLPTWPKRERRAAYLLILGAVGLFWVTVPRMVTVLQQLFSQIGAETSSQSRIGAYSAAIPFIAGHPWFGRGFQTFFPQTYFFVDNQYLTSLIETGFVGLLALLALFVTGWCLARSARRSVTDPKTRDLLQCLAGSVAVAAVSFSTFDGLSFTIATGLTFLVMGCVGAAWRLARAQPPQSAGPG
jgi:O-antigen ligase